MFIYRLKIFYYTFRLVNIFRRWLAGISQTTKTYTQDVSKYDNNTHEALSRDLASYEHVFLELSARRDSSFQDFTKNNLSTVDECWAQCEIKWHALHSQVRLLGDYLQNKDGVDNIMSDFDALESWLDENERTISSSENLQSSTLSQSSTLTSSTITPSTLSPVSTTLQKVGVECDENRLLKAIHEQNNLENFLRMQSEKLNTVCEKVDSFKLNKHTDNTANCTEEGSCENANTANQFNKCFVQKKRSIADDRRSDQEEFVDHHPKNPCKGDSNDNNNANGNEIGNVKSNSEDSNNNNNIKKTKKLVGLLKKERPLSMPKKRVIFSTTHEFSDCHTVQKFHLLNDEHNGSHSSDKDCGGDFFPDDNDFSDDDDFYDNNNDYDDGVFEDDFVFGEHVESPPSYFPEPPQDFLQLSEHENQHEEGKISTIQNI